MVNSMKMLREVSGIHSICIYNPNSFTMVYRTKSLFGCFLLSVLLGPLSLFYVSFWAGLTMLFLPVIVLSFVSYEFLDNNMLLLRHYPMSLMIWGAVYWLLCIICMTALVHEQNTMIREALEENGEIEEDRVNVHMLSWLQDNTGKTVNDYFARHPH